MKGRVAFCEISNTNCMYFLQEHRQHNTTAIRVTCMLRISSVVCRAHYKSVELPFAFVITHEASLFLLSTHGDYITTNAKMVIGNDLCSRLWKPAGRCF